MKFRFAFIAGLALATAIIACNSSSTQDNSGGEGDPANGEKVYQRYCVLCHGEDGKKEMNGAKDITISQLTFDERVALITGGRNLMTPFEGILHEQEIADVAAYSMTLPK